jgi:serine/threonine protein kinase
MSPSPTDYSEILDRLIDGIQSDRRFDVDSFLERHPRESPRLREDLENLGLLGLAAAGAHGEIESDDGPVGRTIGGYRVLDEIGRGGMGIVYEAEDRAQGVRVALKLLPPSFFLNEKAVERFQREARAAAKLTHANIIPVHSIGVEDRHHYYAMELVDGRALSEILDDLERSSTERLEGRDLDAAIAGSGPERDQRRDASAPPRDPARAPSVAREYVRRACELVAQVADALEEAHRHGILHRDVKPANILVNREGVPKLMDFGLARIETLETLTRTGELLGTPAYMSPEQLLARRVKIDCRTDIYSLGVTLYEMLTLAWPYEGRTSQELIKNIMIGEPRPPRRVNPRIPRDLNTVLMRALEKDPDHRYPRAAEFAADLRRFVRGQPVRARPASLLRRVGRQVRQRREIAIGIAGVVLTAAVILGLRLPGGSGDAPGDDRTPVQLAEDGRNALADRNPLVGVPDLLSLLLHPDAGPVEKVQAETALAGFFLEWNLAESADAFSRAACGTADADEVPDDLRAGAWLAWARVLLAQGRFAECRAVIEDRYLPLPGSDAGRVDLLRILASSLTDDPVAFEFRGEGIVSLQSLDLEGDGRFELAVRDAAGASFHRFDPGIGSYREAAPAVEWSELQWLATADLGPALGRVLLTASKLPRDPESGILRRRIGVHRLAESGWEPVGAPFAVDGDCTPHSIVGADVVGDGRHDLYFGVNGDVKDVQRGLFRFRLDEDTGEWRLVENVLPSVEEAESELRFQIEWTRNPRTDIPQVLSLRVLPPAWTGRHADALAVASGMDLGLRAFVAAWEPTSESAEAGAAANEARGGNWTALSWTEPLGDVSCLEVSKDWMHLGVKTLRQTRVDLDEPRAGVYSAPWSGPGYVELSPRPPAIWVGENSYGPDSMRFASLADPASDSARTVLTYLESRRFRGLPSRPALVIREEKASIGLGIEHRIDLGSLGREESPYAAEARVGDLDGDGRPELGWGFAGESGRATWFVHGLGEPKGKPVPSLDLRDDLEATLVHLGVFPFLNAGYVERFDRVVRDAAGRGEPDALALAEGMILAHEGRFSEIDPDRLDRFPRELRSPETDKVFDEISTWSHLEGIGRFALREEIPSDPEAWEGPSALPPARDRRGGLAFDLGRPVGGRSELVWTLRERIPDDTFRIRLDAQMQRFGAGASGRIGLRPFRDRPPEVRDGSADPSVSASDSRNPEVIVQCEFAAAGDDDARIHEAVLRMPARDHLRHSRVLGREMKPYVRYRITITVRRETSRTSVWATVAPADRVDDPTAAVTYLAGSFESLAGPIELFVAEPSASRMKTGTLVLDNIVVETAE